MGRGYANVGWLGLDANQWRAEPKSMTQLTCFNGLWVKPGVSASQEIIFACGKIKMKPYSQTQQPLTLPAPVLSFTYDLLPIWPSLTHKEIPQVRKLWARDILPIFKHIFTGIETARRRLWTVPLSGRWIKGSCWYMFQYCSADQSEHPPPRNELSVYLL